MGKAAHITAAAPGGPRYNALLSPQQRKHADNGIWLCANHADEVDSNEARFSVDELRRWKDAAELAAETEIGNRLPSKDDAPNQMVALFKQAPAHFVGDAIPNVHEAMGRSLSALDPRIRVHTGFDNGKATYHLTPLEDLTVELVPEDTQAADALARALESVRRDGGEVSLEMNGIALKGSPVFDALHAPGSMLTVGAVPEDAVLRLVFPPDQDGAHPFVVEFQGRAHRGTESITFEGSAFGGLFRPRFAFPLQPGAALQPITLSFAWGKWDGIDVRDLPHWTRARRFVRHISKGDLATVDLEVDGRPCLTSGIDTPADPAVFQVIERAFQYIDNAAVIADFSATPIPFDLTAAPSAAAMRDVRDLADALRSIKRPKALGRDDTFKGGVRISAEIREDLTKGGPRFVRFEVPERELAVFGTAVKVSALTIILTKMTLKFHGAPRRRLRPGDNVRLEAVPNEGATMQCWVRRTNQMRDPSRRHP
jgi:hypothetical protein